MKPSTTPEKLINLLKTKGPQTAKTLSETLHITAMGVRQHLYKLEEEGFISYYDERAKVGRPTRFWQLTPQAENFFPDSHSDLIVSVLDSVSSLFGNNGLYRLLSHRQQESIKQYQDKLSHCDDLEQKVMTLVEIRTEEGYMASYYSEDSGYVLIEAHCPICQAAKACQGFCETELELFRSVLGPQVEVTRTEHILSGQRRCAYQILPKLINQPIEADQLSAI